MFHLAFPIIDLEKTILFYTEVLGARLGRYAETWADFDLYGNQITVQVDAHLEEKKLKYNALGVPSDHFGIILPLTEWKKLADRFVENNIRFLIQPNVVFSGEIGEQHSFFILDPSGYAIEFKGFDNLDNLFKRG